MISAPIIYKCILSAQIVHNFINLGCEINTNGDEKTNNTWQKVMDELRYELNALSIDFKTEHHKQQITSVSLGDLADRSQRREIIMALTSETSFIVISTSDRPGRSTQRIHQYNTEKLNKKWKRIQKNFVMCSWPNNDSHKLLLVRNTMTNKYTFTRRTKYLLYNKIFYEE